jgi:poly-gamma-glutamate capsule biosynthesis protein CapA/YwtB (metallophosphatase superfamily)
LDKLGELGIAYIGAGLNKADALKPYYLAKGSLTAGILALNAFPPQEMAAGQNRLGVASGNAEELPALLKEMTKQSDIIIVMVSFPAVSGPGATDSQKIFARSLIDLGAHIVVGSGGDIIQETEIYRQGAIFYNLGNIMAGTSGYGYAQEAVLLQFSFSPGGTSEVKALPVQSTGPTTLVPAKGLTGSLLHYKIFKRLQGKSPWQKHKSFYFLELPVFYQ